MTSNEMNILQMDDEGYTVQQICDTLAVTPSMVWEVLMREINESEGEILCEVEMDDEQQYEEHDQFRDDVEADADVLASAGWGTDEDYGYYGEDF